MSVLMNERSKKSLDAVLRLLEGAKPDEYGEVIDAACRTLRRVLHPVSTRVDTKERR